MKVGFTGSRNGITTVQAHAIEQLLSRLSATEVHHGDCVGADAYFHSIATRLSLYVVIHPPTDDRHRAYSKGALRTCTPLDYLVRNKNIVVSTQLLIAAVQGRERQRSGTWATVRFARQLRRPIAIVETSGQLTLGNDFPLRPDEFNLSRSTD